MADAMAECCDADVFINFSSLRSAHETRLDIGRECVVMS